MMNQTHTYWMSRFAEDKDGNQIPLVDMEPVLFRIVTMDTGKVLYTAILSKHDITCVWQNESTECGS
ncbi:MAG: hypothetical protein FD169_1310 [Bacillota bacterium]|nr:MAG: hypothetical protein FD169_1310 [Bacillota bacterium]